MNKKHNLKIGYVIKGYLAFPIAVGVVILALGIGFLFVNKTAAFVTLIVFAAYAVIAAIFITVNYKRLMSGLLKFVRSYENMERELIDDFPIPYAVTDIKGDIILYNELFSMMYDEENDSRNLCDIFPEIEPEDLDFMEDTTDISVIYGKRNYRVNIRKMDIDRRILDTKIALPPRADMKIYVVYLFDETEIINMVRKGIEERLVVATVYIDNYEETLDQSADVKRSLVSAMVDRAINVYFQNANALVRKIEKDRYFVVFKHKYLSVFQRDKFKLLDDVKKIDTGSDIPATLSIGIGVGDDYMKNSENARLALELALGRGGDQAVIKDGERIYYYGGKTKQVEKNTRVRARVKAIALKELLEDAGHVVIMGHKGCDVDCFGAACGIYRVAKSIGKDAYIILNDLNNAVRPVISKFKADEEYKSVFIRSSEAEAYVDMNTALVIVDANSPGYFECPELLEQTKTIMVIDHHRQSGERIDSLVFSYQEPGASSASEMVTEIIKYVSENIKIKKIEAEALLAGILIDTNYFSKDTGIRTFEAAAYLKKEGVEVGDIKNMFKDSFEEKVAKADALKNSELLSDRFAITVCNAEGLGNPTVTAAQVANELLEINGIEGSFVLADISGIIYISARSLGDVNVQLVMEKMGGGGHMNSAGVQIEKGTVAEAKKNLISIVKKMIEEEML